MTHKTLTTNPPIEKLHKFKKVPLKQANQQPTVKWRQMRKLKQC